MKYFWFVALLLFSGAAEALQSNLPLDQAARDGNLAEVQRLIKQGANPNEINKWGTSALTGASTYGADSPSHTEIVRYLLAHGAEVNKRVAGGTTALNEASFWGHVDTVRVLLDARADVNVAKDNGYTPLLGAASRRHAQIVQLLIAAGAELNRQTRNGLTALHLASSFGYEDIVSTLLAAGARTDIKSIRGESYKDVAGRTEGQIFP